MAKRKKQILQCLGFGEFENHCEAKAGPVNPFWCDRCNKLRMEHLGKQFEKLARVIMDPSSVGKKSESDR